MESKEYTTKDIEQIVVLVQIDKNCHQVLLSNPDKDILKLFLSNLTDGMKLSKELMPVEFINK